jgi:hypothetical protein
LRIDEELQHILLKLQQYKRAKHREEHWPNSLETPPVLFDVLVVDPRSSLGDSLKRFSMIHLGVIRLRKIDIERIACTYDVSNIFKHLMRTLVS